MRNPENDVPLSDGTGFMVSKKPYELHLKLAVQRWQVSFIKEACVLVGICSHLDRIQCVMITTQQTTQTGIVAILNQLELGPWHVYMGLLYQIL